MKINYVLIDYENVQPTDVQMLNQDYFYVVVFLGVNQTKISSDMAMIFQEMGSRAKYIKISGNGPNALDFHIAFYVGQLTGQYPDAYFHIISNDTGFDPLIQHLRDRKIFINRSKNISEMPIFRMISSVLPVVAPSVMASPIEIAPIAALPVGFNDKIIMVKKDLQKRGNSRPGTIDALFSTINSLFRKSLSEDELSLIMRELHYQRIITITETKIVYHFEVE